MAKISPLLFARFLLFAPGGLAGLIVDVANADNVKQTAQSVAQDLMSYYTGAIPGILPEDNYYWYTGGMLWNHMLDYRARTGNTSWDETIRTGLQFQTGSNDDYLPANWSLTIGNDDQAGWALAALTAAQTDLESPPADGTQWVDLAKSVFDEQSSDGRRAQTGDCEGALRWQIFSSSNGYNYISSAANGAYFNLGARLASFESNKTRADLAKDTYELMTGMGIIDDDFNVYDGISLPDCDAINKRQWTYNAGLFIEGAAYMYNFTNDDTWKTRLDGLVSRSMEVFFPDGVAEERACEPVGTCEFGTRGFADYRAYLHRGLASAMKLAPYTADTILPTLQSSAKAAVAQCTAGDNGRMCGASWTNGTNDGETNALSEMSVLAALNSIITTEAEINSTDSGGNGTSTGGTDDASSSDNPESAGIRAGISVAAVMGALVVGLMALS
ncbi:glycoside hydrolase family 76 protein [Xylariaceae sp. FL0016]|nr:glycoside hydrolase family 76 protein [Xylariaceae sp. FL0016]